MKGGDSVALHEEPVGTGAMAFSFLSSQIEGLVSQILCCFLVGLSFRTFSTTTSSWRHQLFTLLVRTPSVQAVETMCEDFRDSWSSSAFVPGPLSASSPKTSCTLK